jgi:hypothetical protein
MNVSLMVYFLIRRDARNAELITSACVSSCTRPHARTTRSKTFFYSPIRRDNTFFISGNHLNTLLSIANSEPQHSSPLKKGSAKQGPSTMKKRLSLSNTSETEVRPPTPSLWAI